MIITAELWQMVKTSQKIQIPFEMENASWYSSQVFDIITLNLITDNWKGMSQFQRWRRSEGQRVGGMLGYIHKDVE